MKYDMTKGLFVQLSANDIEKIEYIHGKEPTESIQNAYNRLGCDIIVNANFFSMSTGKTCGEVIDEGKTLSTGMSPYGFAFVDKKKPVFSYKNSVKAIDFVGGYPCLLKDNKVYIDTNESGFSATSTAARGRTALGITANGDFIIRSIADTDSKNKISIKNLALQLQKYGCINAINLDGGGSAQWITPWGKFISGRKVDGFVAVWLKKKTSEGDKTMFNKNDVVTFLGGNVYSSASAIKAAKTVDKQSECTITSVYEKGTHPYHCVSKDGNGVYGWVDANCIKAKTQEIVKEDKPADYAKEAWEAACKKGVLDGTSPQGNVTREMLAVILDRLGLLD